MIPPSVLQHPAAAALPAAAIAGEVNRLLATHGRLVICAPPGAGKSTLLPLTMREALPEDGKILMLEPRRMAARQVADRMAWLLGEEPGGTVGYRIRFERRTGPRTRVEVLTEGILTRMLVDDPTLEGVSAVLFDEFHERSLQTDLALALVLEAQRQVRPDLRVVLMSATLETADLCERLDAALAESDGRLFPVEERYAETDCRPEEAADEAGRAVLRACREREGDVLAFLPGEAEIRRCAERLAESDPDTAPKGMGQHIKHAVHLVNVVGGREHACLNRCRDCMGIPDRDCRRLSVGNINHSFKDRTHALRHEVPDPAQRHAGQAAQRLCLQQLPCIFFQELFYPRTFQNF